MYWYISRHVNPWNPKTLPYNRMQGVGKSLCRLYAIVPCVIVPCAKSIQGLEEKGSAILWGVWQLRGRGGSLACWCGLGSCNTSQGRRVNKPWLGWESLWWCFPPCVGCVCDEYPWWKILKHWRDVGQLRPPTGRAFQQLLYHSAMQFVSMLLILPEWKFIRIWGYLRSSGLPLWCHYAFNTTKPSLL